MPRTLKRIWIVYAVLSVSFVLYGLTEHGDMFAWSLLLALPHLGFVMWYAFHSDPED